MYKLATIVSYISLLLLIMDKTAHDIIQTAVLAALGTILIVWKARELKFKTVPKSSRLTAALLSASVGLRFYRLWIVSSNVSAVAGILHLSPAVLLLVVTVGLCLCAYFFLIGILQFTRKVLIAISTKNPLAGNLVCCLLAAVATIFLSQTMIDVDMLSMGLLKFLGGTLIVAIVILAIYCLSGSVKLAITLGTVIFLILSTVNVYVFQFRNHLFEPVDFFAIGTAMNVASNYSLFPIPVSVLVGWGIWVGMLNCLFSMCTQKNQPSSKARVILALFCLVGFLSVFCYATNLKTYHWLKEGATLNGYVLDFFSKFKEAYISVPKGYSKEHIDELSDQYPVHTALADAEDHPPHMIVIMDEAFADLGVMGELSTNKEVIPFISSLKQDVISGYALASVFGGNTANSEYEFLTGNSMAWLSPNAVPYQQHIKSPAYSMVSYLKTHYDYQCIAMHPYKSSGWNRPEAYRLLGFDDYFFLEGFPQKQYIRQYISDQEMFETIVSTYESHREQPLFLFGVTMQNHGDYAYSGENYTQSISLVGYNQEYPDVSQYLSLLHETDKAVEYLISYFQDVDDDVVIVFFGDHQPVVDDAFYQELSNCTFTSLDQQQNKYLVPFFVWANYDIEENYVERTSLNYLSSFVYDAAGIPLPPYNQFLTEMERRIPAINANGFYSKKSQCYLPFDMADAEEEMWLQTYKQLHYNNTFDKKHRNKLLFPTLD